MKKHILITLLALGVFGFAAHAQKPDVETSNAAGWHKIAEMSVDIKKMDHDEVAVMGKDHFKSIKLKVTDADVEFMDLTVYFENDTKQDIPVRSLIRAGGETRVMDLEGKGNELAIKKISLTYKTVPSSEKDKAHVEIWGLK